MVLKNPLIGELRVLRLNLSFSANEANRKIFLHDVFISYLSL